MPYLFLFFELLYFSASTMRLTSNNDLSHLGHSKSNSTAQTLNPKPAYWFKCRRHVYIPKECRQARRQALDA